MGIDTGPLFKALQNIILLFMVPVYLKNTTSYKRHENLTFHSKCEEAKSGSLLTAREL